MRFIKLMSALLVISLLTGCTGSAAMVGGVSRKYDSKQGMPSNQSQQCHQWCHNGWCSTHCDPVMSGS